MQIDSASPSSKTLAPPSDWIVWQMIDSGLPTGGFAHSYGLEAAVQLGQYDMKAKSEERRISGLLSFCRQALSQQAALLLPIVRVSHHYAGLIIKDPPLLIKQWSDLDAQCQALVTTEGGRRASLAQGQALFRLACEAFPTPPLSTSHRLALRKARDKIRQQDGKGPVGHHPAIFGWLCQALGVSSEITARMFLFLVLRDIMAAATRLGLVGPLLAVRLQMSLFTEAEQAARSATATDTAGVGGETMNGSNCHHDSNGYSTSIPSQGPRQDNPLLDILQGAHEKLYSRLFNS